MGMRLITRKVGRHNRAGSEILKRNVDIFTWVAYMNIVVQIEIIFDMVESERSQISDLKMATWESDVAGVN